MYQISKACTFWFHLRRFLKGGGWGGGGQFWPQSNNLNNLGRGPLGEVLYQISKAWAFCFQTRRFLKFFPKWVYVKQVTSSAGPFLTPGL